MNNFIKQVIEEKFASKKQQRYFYAKASDPSLSKKERKKWSKWAKEFSGDTDFKNLPDKKEEDVDEVVDSNGNINTSKKPTNLGVKGISQKKTTDDVVKTGGGSMGIHGVHGTHTSLRYWAESDMSKSLGYQDTMGKDEDMEDAEKHFEKELGLSDDETKERLAKMGYDPELPDDKVRLVENPKKFMEEYIESILSKKNKQNDLVSKGEEVKEINPILKKQIKSLKNNLDTNNLSIEDIIKYFKENE